MSADPRVALELRLPEPGSFEDLFRPVRVEVAADDLTERSFGRVSCERRKRLVLADLAGAALKSPGLNNGICASGDCSASQAWARGIYGESTRRDGIRWASRQMNNGFACATFDRCGRRSARRGRWTTSAIGST